MLCKLCVACACTLVVAVSCHSHNLHALSAQAGTVCSSPKCCDRTAVRPVVRAACGCAFHVDAPCRPADGQCPTCPPRYAAIVRELCESRNALVQRLVAEQCGDEVPDVVADDDVEDDDDEDDVLAAGDEAEEAFAPAEPAEVAPEQFAQLLAAALRKW